MKKITAHLSAGGILSNDPNAFSLFKKSSFGETVDEKIKYTLCEGIYLLETAKIEILQKEKPLSKKELIDKLKKIDKKIEIKYPVYKDLRSKGYIPKSALKFGAEFRVYEKGKSPGKAHAKWIVFTDTENKNISWHEFSAKNRVAHSTKKKLLLAIVDEENDVTYYEVSWLKI